jgi:hypothetical protein
VLNWRAECSLSAVDERPHRSRINEIRRSSYSNAHVAAAIGREKIAGGHSRKNAKPCTSEQDSTLPPITPRLYRPNTRIITAID